MDEGKLKENLYKYMDGQMTPQEREGFEKYLKENPLCEIELEKEKNFSQWVKQNTAKEEAPFELREAVVNDLEKQSPFSFIPGWEGLAPVLKPAGVFLIIAALIFGVWTKESSTLPLFDESITRHMDHLKGGYPMEIRTGDMETVSKWFEGKLDFAVKMPVINDDRVELIGARLCHIKGRKVAYLTYAMNNHKISVFVMDLDDVRIPRAKRVKEPRRTFYVKSDKGFQSILCVDERAPDIGCVFVSDLSDDQLIQLTS